MNGTFNFLGLPPGSQKVVDGLVSHNKILERENTRLRAALEKYADPEQWVHHSIAKMSFECYKFSSGWDKPWLIAQEALNDDGTAED